MLDIDELSAKVEAMGNAIAEERSEDLAMVVAGLNVKGDIDHVFGFVTGKRGLLVRAIAKVFERHPELMGDIVALIEAAKARKESQVEESAPEKAHEEVGGGK